VKIPDVIRIGGHDVKIKKVNCSDERDSGIYDDWYRFIKINQDGHPESGQAEALMHEILEAITKINNIELNHTALTVISEQLFAIIRNNRLDFVNP